jgi:hypothetical protein
MTKMAVFRITDFGLPDSYQHKINIKSSVKVLETSSGCRILISIQNKSMTKMAAFRITDFGLSDSYQYKINQWQKWQRSRLLTLGCQIHINAK